LFAELNALIHDPNFIDKHKVHAKDFTRDRSLPFHMIIAFLINFVKNSLQCELDNFFASLSGSCELLRKVTKSAFSQARSKLNPSAFIALNHCLIQFTQRHCFQCRWRGFRIIAGDSSGLRLPNHLSLAQHFGLHGTDAGCPYVVAKAFGLLDVTNKIIIHGQLAPHASCERTLLINSLSHLDPQDLLVLDRGFPAFWVFAALYQHQQAFCARIDNNGFAFVNKFLRSRKNDSVVTMSPSYEAKKRCKELNLPVTPIQLRLIRIRRPKGKTQVLATSLLDQHAFPAQEFADLYHQRWGIEEWFKILKCRLLVEQFSGLTPLAIEQDFHAKIFAANLCACLSQEAQALVSSAKQSRYRVNFSYALSACKNVLPRFLLNQFSPNNLHSLIALISNTLERCRPMRSYPRRHRPIKPAYHRAYCTPR